MSYFISLSPGLLRPNSHTLSIVRNSVLVKGSLRLQKHKPLPLPHNSVRSRFYTTRNLLLTRVDSPGTPSLKFHDDDSGGDTQRPYAVGIFEADFTFQSSRNFRFRRIKRTTSPYKIKGSFSDRFQCGYVEVYRSSSNTRYRVLTRTLSSDVCIGPRLENS